MPCDRQSLTQRHFQDIRGSGCKFITIVNQFHPPTVGTDNRGAINKTIPLENIFECSAHRPFHSYGFLLNLFFVAPGSLVEAYRITYRLNQIGTGTPPSQAGPITAHRTASSLLHKQITICSQYGRKSDRNV